MKRSFLLGLLLGIGAAVAVAGWYPLFDPARLPSESGVAKNGGRIETFHTRLPEDRIAVTGAGALAISEMPAGVRFPASRELADLRVELFRLRNESGRVIGLASRINGKSPYDVGYTDWMLFLPARGTLFLQAGTPLGWPYRVAGGMEEVPDVLGDIVGGAGEFAGFAGSFREQWALTGRTEEGRLAGEIRLATVTLGTGQ